MANILALIGFGSTLIGIGQVIYTYLENNEREKRLLSAFHQGTVSVVGNDNFIERPGISKHVREILQPPQGYDSYDMIVGFQGTGKTTLVRNVSHQHQGIIYVNVGTLNTSEDGFARAFAEALRWTPCRCSWFEVLLSIDSITRKHPKFGKLSQLDYSSSEGNNLITILT